MSRSAITTQRVFAITLAGTLVLALLPTDWLRGWTADAADILKLPTTPIEHAGTAVRQWLRPPRASHTLDDLSGDAEEIIEQLSRERDRERDLRRRQEMVTRELREQLEELRRIEIEPENGDVRLLDAAAYAHNPHLPVGTVELNRGRRHGVREGSVVVFRSHVIGRISRVQYLRSYVTPITSQSVGVMRGVVFPQEHADEPMRDDWMIDLIPQGGGVFHATIDHTADVGTGDVVRLNDPAWHSAARGMIVGRVESVRTHDDEPLRRRLVIRAMYRPHELSTVVIMIDQSTGDAGPDHEEGGTS